MLYDVIVAGLIFNLIAAEVPQPPVECRHEPTVPYTITELDARYIPGVCNQPTNRRILGCAYIDRNDIFMPKVDGFYITQAIYDAILVHEKGHVNCGAWHD